MPCVYYRIKISEERVREVIVRDQNGNTSSRTEHYWVQIVDHEQMADFYLQDGVSKVFINGSNRGQCKVQATDDGAGGSNYFSAPPPGVAWLIAQHCTSFGGWGMMSGRTGTSENPASLP